MKIGIMSFAHTHASTYASLLRGRDDVELLAADPGGHRANELRGRALAESMGVPYVDSYEELLEWGPEAVIITSENAKHRELVEIAAAAGAHILCEKPLATTWADGQAIQAAVERNGVLLMVAYPVRFASDFARLRTEHDAGLLGEIVSIRGSNNGKLPLERSWFTEPELSGGGALVDHVVHIADLIEALTGAEPERVTAVSNAILHSERARAETAGLVTIEYADGIVATVDCSWSVPESAPTWGGVRISVAATRGTTELDFFGPAVRGIDALTGRPLVRPYGPSLDETMLGAFLTAVRAGRQPEVSLQSGLRTLSIVLAAQESARTGTSVAVCAMTSG
ncbi:Gfo/Idh/MocA family oxidoreductase [Microbacterium oryzae]|uniref:Gfo/Idh/MocA family protein n=1 Tax=Microbacterium oryzae TaxID=743009 RepID=UPI0025B110C7|nr:Gfo/Idh/MocA family oxidoreductase [Microbacterium oryzae]MDN3311712.1 Gfo/Idh/MocA family oxidoreductase [Microbacterium oryzae]